MSIIHYVAAFGILFILVASILVNNLNLTQKYKLKSKEFLMQRNCQIEKKLKMLLLSVFFIVPVIIFFMVYFLSGINFEVVVSIGMCIIFITIIIFGYCKKESSVIQNLLKDV